ncbi:MAG: hypothetical protein PHZ02_10410 [Desulfocapsaceae bacterium]|nr:hypothetical protein [Desulfocapsaceae bacterium]
MAVIMLPEGVFVAGHSLGDTLSPHKLTIFSLAFLIITWIVWLRKCLPAKD